MQFSQYYYNKSELSAYAYFMGCCTEEKYVVHVIIFLKIFDGVSGNKSEANTQLLSKSRYITEIVVNVQPLDFILSLNTLRSFYLVLVS